MSFTSPITWPSQINWFQGSQCHNYHVWVGWSIARFVIILCSYYSWHMSWHAKWYTRTCVFDYIRWHMVGRHVETSSHIHMWFKSWYRWQNLVRSLHTYETWKLVLHHSKICKSTIMGSSHCTFIDVGWLPVTHTCACSGCRLPIAKYNSSKNESLLISLSTGRLLVACSPSFNGRLATGKLRQ